MMRKFTVLMLLVVLTMGINPGQATNLFALQGERVFINGKKGMMDTKRLTQRQLQGLLDQAQEQGWSLNEKLNRDEILVYQLTRKERQLELSYWVRAQLAVIVEMGTKIERDFLKDLSHPPGELKLSFATEGKEGICSFACFATSPGSLHNYRLRLEADGWERWFAGKVELWERNGERLGLRRNPDGILVVWSLGKRGKKLAQL